MIQDYLKIKNSIDIRNGNIDLNIKTSFFFQIAVKIAI